QGEPACPCWRRPWRHRAQRRARRQANPRSTSGSQRFAHGRARVVYPTPHTRRLWAVSNRIQQFLSSIVSSPNSTNNSGNISTAASPTDASPPAKRRRRNTRHFWRGSKDYGVDRGIMLGLWGIESAFGDPDVQKNHMRPVIPALAALAWGDPRRRAYWEQELLNALVIIDRGWGTSQEMRGSWAGAMGHTQWMPEVWLNVGLDYDGGGRVSPFGKPDDALAGTAQYLVKRGRYRPGEHWGYEVRAVGRTSGEGASRTYDAWQRAGVTRADGQAFPQASASARLWVPVPGGPAFLLGANVYAVRSYNPSMNYTLSIVHLGDRIMGGGPFVQPFPGGERTPTLAEVQEIQQRLTTLGFDTGGTDGRVGNDTMLAVRNFQRKVG